MTLRSTNLTHGDEQVLFLDAVDGEHVIKLVCVTFFAAPNQCCPPWPCLPFALQSKKKLERTKRFLQLGTAVYIILLLLMCMFDNIDLAMVVQLGAIGLGMTACGSGAAKVSIGH